MRTSLRRVLAGTSALTMLSAGLVLGTAAPAAAEGSATCTQTESTRLLTANDGLYKVWLYQANGDVHVCFGIGYDLRGDLIFRSGLGGSLVPTVVPDPDASDCASYLHLQDPADLRIQFEWTASLPAYFCIGAEGTAVGIALSGANGTVNPRPELWLDFSLIAQTYCWLVMESNCYSDWPKRVL